MAGVLPLFIMTSPLNDATTRAFFADNSYFGLEPAHVHFFVQGTLPALSEDGKVANRKPFPATWF